MRFVACAYVSHYCLEHEILVLFWSSLPLITAIIKHVGISYFTYRVLLTLHFLHGFINFSAFKKDYVLYFCSCDSLHQVFSLSCFLPFSLSWYDYTVHSFSASQKMYNNWSLFFFSGYSLYTFIKVINPKGL